MSISEMGGSKSGSPPARATSPCSARRSKGDAWPVRRRRDGEGYRLVDVIDVAMRLMWKSQPRVAAPTVPGICRRARKYELWVSVLIGESTQGEAARKYKVGRSTVVTVCRTAKQGALEALRSCSLPTVLSP